MGNIFLETTPWWLPGLIHRTPPFNVCNAQVEKQCGAVLKMEMLKLEIMIVMMLIISMDNQKAKYFIYYIWLILLLKYFYYFILFFIVYDSRRFA